MSKIDVIEDLSNKKLSTVPDYVLTMTNLKMLYLEGNELTELPAELFTCLDKLVWLDVRNNKLETIPETVMHHPCLETILLQENKIEKLPTELGFVPKLKVLHLSGNPISYPPKTIVEQGLPNIQSFLRNENKFKNQTAEQVLTQISYLTNDPSVTSVAHQFSTPDKYAVEMPIVSLKTLYKKDHSLRKKELKKRKLHNTNAKANVYKDSPYANSNKYLHMLPKRKNELRIDQQYIKDLWMSKLKELMAAQDDALQKQKNKNAIMQWRHNVKFKNKKSNLSYRPHVPFDYDQDFDRIPSRNELQNQKLTLSVKRARQLSKPRNINVEKLITDIIQSLKDLEEERNIEKSPRTQMGYAGHEIKRIVELQKRLSALKLTNDRSI